MEVFSTNFLFLYGEYSAFVSLRNQGPFYYVDVLFLIVGICVLFSLNRKIWVFLTTLVLISPLPSVANAEGSSYSIRSSLLFPLIVLFISVGIWYIITLRKSRLYRYSMSAILAFTYTVLAANFSYNYFFRYPVYGAETFNFSGRIASKYMELARNKGKKVIIIEHTDKLASISLFKQYLFYSNTYNKSTADEIARLINEKGPTFQHITAMLCSEHIPLENAVVIMASGPCASIQTKSDKLSIAQLSDGGEIYDVFDNYICKNYNLSRYPNGIKIKDLEIEKLSERAFCEKFITNLN